MILSHRKKFIFIHIYKVAGTSIRRALNQFDDLSLSDFKVQYATKFFLGRHFPFLASWNEIHLSALKAKNCLPSEIFNNYYKFSFVRNPWDWQVSLYHFMLQTEFHDQHELIRKMKGFDEYIEWRINHGLELQRDFLYDKNGNLLVDFVGRYENIQSDFDAVCKKLDIGRIQLPEMNVSQHDHYSKYYNEHTKNLIGRAYQEDIELFKYQF